MATSATPVTRKRLALAIIDYLNTSVADGTLSPEDKESVEVATSCIADAFKVDPTDSAAVADALGQGQNLLSIYTVYEKLRGKGTPAADGASSAKEVPPSAASPAEKSGEAEALKSQGNAAMREKDYAAAIDFYTKAIALDPVNPIYLCNRAAAYTATSQHQLAKEDAELAVAGDPNYVKAWSRLGLARYALGDAKGSMEAYKRGIEVEGNGGSDLMRKGYETAKRKVEELEADDVGSPRSTMPPGAGAGGGMPDLSSLAGMFGGGGAGGGGMPDFSEMMKNPMMQQMAQNMMSNPEMMNNLMNNPKLRDMASQYMGGGGGAGGGGGGAPPDISGLMQDPNIAEMARNILGGGAGGAGRGAGAGPGSAGTGS